MGRCHFFGSTQVALRRPAAIVRNSSAILSALFRLSGESILRIVSSVTRGLLSTSHLLLFYHNPSHPRMSKFVTMTFIL